MSALGTPKVPGRLIQLVGNILNSHPAQVEIGLLVLLVLSFPFYVASLKEALYCVYLVLMLVFDQIF